MTAERPNIYLVSGRDADWKKRFRELAGDRYEIAELSPAGLTGESPGKDLVKGVVVFYEPDAGSPNQEWFARVRACVHFTDLPVIAVAPNPSVATRAQLIAAGASTVCDAESDPEQVLSEVENRCNIEPVLTELREQLLEPFVEATLLTLKEMAQADAKVHTVYRKLGYRIFGDYSALVGLKSDSEGTLVVTFPKATGDELAKRVLAPLGIGVTDELVQSCLAEIANIIVGQAKGKLAGTNYRFQMSIPTVVAGPNHEIKYKQGLPCLVASFTGDIGDFALQICMAF